uniref:hypothetical protein n=1 Tax=Campylobacter helveticus TaxID=28898 RepID=UPI00164F6B88
ELFHHQSRFVEDEKEGVVCTEVSYPKKETKKIVFANENIDLNTSFAPGTYIKLQLEEKETSEELTWAYIHCESETKKESFLNGAYIIKPEELKNIKYDATNKTSVFHLPISRNNEPVEETKDYKYYIIVFAYDAKKKSVPNEEDAYIIIDMSFRVGVGSDENVRESVLSSGLKSDTDFTAEWKKLNLIADFYDAYNFITLSLLSIQAINSLEKLKNYPQLSGKIVYIYHRFNAVKIYHQIKSKSDMQIKYKNYFQDINDYESKVIKVLKEFQYKADEIYPIKWWGNLTRKICENFNLNINIQTISGDYDGAYDTKTLTISLNQKDAKKTKVMLKTIIHEIRHAYMHQKELKNDALQRYIYYTYLYVYFDKNKNKEYFGTDKDETKNVYFFQPSESEARAIENDIIKEMQ